MSPADPQTEPAAPRRRVRAPLLALVALTGAALLGLALSGVADRAGAANVQAGLQRALVAFGLARALNGVISVVQGTEVAIQPAGVGINLAPGQILDPVNDLVERFSWVMLAASTSFGVQRLLLEVLAWPGVSIALGLLLLLLLLALWQQRGWLAGRRGWLLRLALFVAMLRFLIPLLALLSEGIHHGFIEPRYAAAVAGLEQASDQLGQLAEGESSEHPDQASLLNRLQRLYDETGAALDVQQRLADIKTLAARTTEQTIELISIFVFQTILLPLAFLWLLRGAYRMLVGAWRGVLTRN
jgi:hypothetical protein